MSRENRYKVWWQMVQRCTNPDHPAYHRYGGRGITVCPAWLDFDTYYADTGEPPEPGMTLDRIDNDGPYSPSNCRWATRQEQAANRGEFCHFLTFNGKTQTASEWARELGLNVTTVIWRVKKGWPVDRILTVDSESYKEGKMLTVCGITKPLKQWAEETGLSRGTIQQRLRRGWSPERAVGLT